MKFHKTELQQAFAPPPPKRKREFLRQVSRRQMTFCNFLLSQVCYLKKWVWCATALLFAVSILGAAVLSLNMVWVIASCSPLLALTVLSENGRSERYQMEELELSTRFSLRSVLLARMAVLGIANLVLLAMLLPVALLNNTLSLLAAGLYILTPYMLTACIGLSIARKFRGKDGLYACMGVSVMVSISISLSHIQAPFLYLEPHIPWWFLSLTVLTIATAKHCVNMIQQTEELSWN